MRISSCRWLRRGSVSGLKASQITAEVGSSVILDGSATACPTTPSGTVNGVSYESRRCPLTQGVHNLSGDKPFGIVAYGYGSAGSYAFAGGADVERIYEPPEIK